MPDSFFVFESKSDEISIADAIKSLANPSADSPSVKATSGCTPEACKAILRYIKITPKFLKEGKHPLLGQFLEIEQTGNLGGRWVSVLQNLIKSEASDDRKEILEYLSFQTCLQFQEAEFLFPEIQNNILDSDAQIRYFARKAKDNFQTLYPTLKNWGDGKIEDSPKEAKGAIEPKEILLRKLKLGSRYIVFDAIDRLTESQDTTLTVPLLDFLKEEPDLHKVAHLLQRISRIKDPRISATLETWLNHPEPRVVANALEGLCSCEKPELKEIFLKFSNSEDNRIRANAVRALYQYDPKTAQKNLEEMITSNNIALQDSALYLLGVLLPDNFDSLIDEAISSKFPSIRLNALDTMKQSIISKKLKSFEKKPSGSSEDEGFLGFLASVLIGGALAIISMKFHGTIFLLFILPFLLFGIMILRRGLISEKMFLVSTFVTCLVIGRDPLLALLGIMAIWVGNLHPGPENRQNPSMVAPWLVAIFAFLANEFQLQGISGLYDALGAIGVAQGVHDPILSKIIDERRTFKIIQIACTSVFIPFIFFGYKWFAAKQSDNFKRKFLVGSTLAGCFLTVLLHFFHYLNLNVYLFTQGFVDTDLLIKLLSK
ncbi:HEAT repeat domain-containing protein [bacterium]|nr:HEAT repeat domain-containing protein [bacterium]